MPMAIPRCSGTVKQSSATPELTTMAHRVGASRSFGTSSPMRNSGTSISRCSPLGTDAPTRAPIATAASQPTHSTTPPPR